MFRRRFAAVLVLPALVLTGCSSSGGSAPTSGSRAASDALSSAPSTPGSPAAIALATKIRHGLAGLTSAHVVVDAGELGGTSTGDIRYTTGAVSASDIVLGSGADKTRIVTVGTTSYARLPAGRNTTGKPWVRVSAASKNEFVRALTSSLHLNRAAASLPALADLISTASSVTKRGPTRYAVVIEPARSEGTILRTLLGDTGQKTVPMRVVLDRRGRPAVAAITAQLGSQTFAFTVRASQFNAPVKITAPPAGQVGSG